ncbi:15993_t:CDS:1, partial [Gigaspora rosea]
YYSDEGKVCKQGSRREEGCYIHWKRRQRSLSKQDGCRRPTASKYGFCNLHVNKCHSNAYYYQKKLDKMFQNGQTPEALKQALDKIKISDTK